MKTIVNWSVFLLVVLGVAVLAGPTSLGGPASYVIVDGTSMEPTYQDGDLVVAYESDAYGVGDVIVYDADLQGQFNVIHRIVEPTDGGYVTQGDNRDEPDGWVARPEHIRGTALVHIPHGGDVVEQLRRPAMVAALAAALFMLQYLKREEQKGAPEAPGDEPLPAEPGGGESRRDPAPWTART